ncbi:tripartite tricarboxylate transporter substrate binding protein [Bordetella sp. H567]|uniref:tripartite tricarboxylate transporter substrate binding protein n=1 Tax=Bordetella sp. H567 TaxID=1697043 RepID=UPI001314C4D9|nr:tripartite tricarboxylate transporter substrate binding protein [Bordetella sp. H567]
MLIPAGPGGAVDTVARLLAAKLTVALGQPVVPENRPGAGTVIASDQLAKSKPDGYTILIITGSHAINAAVRRSLPYDPIKDYAPVSLIATLPDLLVVDPSLPVRTVQELIAYARAHANTLTFGSAGSGSSSHLEGELFKVRANVDLLHVPYKTGVDAVTGIVGGQVKVLFFNAIGVAGQIHAGKLRALATTGARRTPLFPEVPTMGEAGVAGFDTGSWYAALLPAGTPPSIVARYHDEIVKALATPDVRQALKATGAEIVGGTPRELEQFIKRDIAQWQDLVQRQPELRVAP